MPIPVLAIAPQVIGVIAKVGGKIGGFFKKLFGGKKRRKRERLAAKQQRIEDSANRVLAIQIAKLEEKAKLGEARARVKLARIEKQLARQGISFDPGVQDASLSDIGRDIPASSRRRRNPQVFQERAQPEFAPVLMAAVPGGAFNINQLFKNPIVLLIIGGIAFLLFSRR